MKEFILALIICFSFVSCSFASELPSIFLNDKQFDTEEIIKNGHILVPIRDIFEAFDRHISWNADDQSIVSGNIRLQIGNPIAKIGDKQVTLDLPVEIINDKTYVPIRFIAKCLGKKVNWDADNNKISISDDKYLANLIRAQKLIEANSKGFEGNIKTTLSLWESCLKNSNNVFKNGVANNIMPQNFTSIYSDFTAREKDINDMLYLLSKPDVDYKDAHEYIIKFYHVYIELKELAIKPTLEPFTTYNNHYTDIMNRFNEIKENLDSL